MKALSKLTKHVTTTAEKVALHKRDCGHDLIITPAGYVEIEGWYGLSRSKAVFPLPDFTSRPSVETLLAPLKEDHA